MTIVCLLVLLWFLPRQAGASHRATGADDRAGITDSDAVSAPTPCLLALALAASAATAPAEAEGLRVLCQGHVAILRGAVSDARTPASRAEIVLAYLHTQILHGVYDPECPDVAVSLRRGDFNCVTATVLYVWLCRGVDVEVAVVSRPGHVYCRLAADPAIAIQTTSPRGFAVGEACSAAVGGPASTGVVLARGERSLDDRALVSKLYYNRGVALLERGEFAEARTVLELSCGMDPADRVALENLVACLNNGALAVCERTAYADSIRLLREAQQLDAENQAVLDNELYVYRLWLEHLCRRERYQDALGVLEDARQRRPEASLFQRGSLIVYRLWYRQLIRTQQPAAAEQILAVARDAYPNEQILWDAVQKS